MKFKLKEDWIHESTFLDKKIVKKLYDKGHIFEPIEGMYEVIHHTGEIFKLSETEMMSFDILEQIKNVEDFEIIIEELPDDDDNLVRNWRIQLDVKTTKKKLKEVQQLIEEHIRPIL